MSLDHITWCSEHGLWASIEVGPQIMACCKEGDFVLDAKVVYFNAHWLADPTPGWEVTFPPPPGDAEVGDEVDMTGVLVKMPGYWKGPRIWRLTGAVCFIEQVGQEMYEGIWPD